MDPQQARNTPPHPDGVHAGERTRLPPPDGPGGDLGLPVSPLAVQFSSATSGGVLRPELQKLVALQPKTKKQWQRHH